MLKRAIYVANEEMLSMYWDIGKLLSESQRQIGWGNNALELLANDLKNDYPKVKGFSVRNCQFMIQFYSEYNQGLINTKQPVSYLKDTSLSLPAKHLSWSHNIVLMQKVKDLKARYWYMIQCLKNGWGRDFLIDAIKQDYYHTYGALANNFDTTLPEIQAKQVKETLKDPYIFDMLTFTDEYDERDIELGLVKHLEKFLVEMGAGFAFMGRQGLLLCQNKNRIMAEYALRDVHKPIGISDYELGKALPKDIKSSLPSIEELENKLSQELLEDGKDVIV